MPCIQPYRGDTSQMLLFKIASCIAEGGAVAGVASFNGRTGVVTLTSADVIAALGCTPACDNNVVTSFNGRQGVVTLTEADVSGVADGRYVLKSGDTMTGSLNIANSAVLVASDPALDITQTWNNAGVTFTGLAANYTLTAASSNSNLFNFQVDGVDRFNFTPGGSLRAVRQDASDSGMNLFLRKRGNAGGATNAVAADSTVGTVAFSSWDGTGFFTGSRVSGLASEAWTNIAHGSRIDLYTTPLGSTAEQIALRLSHTGQSQFLDGTAALPSLTFQSDPDTGIYRIGANSFGSSAGGSLILATSTTGINLTTALAYQYNSVNVIRAQTALENYFFGPSGNLTMTGISNTAIGLNALKANTTGGSNNAHGVGALEANTTGSRNTAIGVSALLVNTTGNSNSAIGGSALLANTTGNSNSAIGFQALAANTTGVNNGAIGFQALQSNTTGDSNNAIGLQALQANTTGVQNTAIGEVALLNITTGSRNTGVGFNTGLGITTGSNNTILGANVVGLAAALSSNIILATGLGVIRLQIDSSGNTTLAGTVQTAAGTAALPAFSFTADPNTGLYNIGADSIGTSTGGTLRITTNTTDVILATAFRLAMASGANQRCGDAVLVGGTVTVANTTVTANTRVFLTRKTAGGTIGFAVTYTLIAATSFTITSDNVLDTSTYSYLLIEVP